MSSRTPERDLRGKETLDIDQDVDLESLRTWRFLTKFEMKSLSRGGGAVGANYHYN